MLLEEFDMDEYIKMERRDSYADGHVDGLAMGLAEGKRLEQLHVVHNMFQKTSLPKTAPTCLTKISLLLITYILYARCTQTGQMKIFTMY